MMPPIKTWKRTASTFGIAKDSLKSGFVDLFRSVFFNGRPHIHRVRWRHPGRKDLGKFLKRPRGEVRQIEAHPVHEIRGYDSGTAAVGQDGRASLSRVFQVCIHGPGSAEIQHLLEIVGLGYMGLGQGAADDGGISGQAGGVAHGSIGPFLALAPFENDDGFAGASAGA